LVGAAGAMAGTSMLIRYPVHRGIRAECRIVGKSRPSNLHM